MLDRLIHAGLSLLVLLAVAILFSTNRRAIRLRVVLAGLALGIARDADGATQMFIAIMSHKAVAALALGIKFVRSKVSWKVRAGGSGPADLPD